MAACGSMPRAISRLAKRFIFSLSGEGGLIKSFDNSGSAVGWHRRCPPDRPLLSRRAADARLRHSRHRPARAAQAAECDADGDLATALMLIEDRDQWTDDALGGKYYYMAAPSWKFRWARAPRNWVSVRRSSWMPARSGACARPRRQDIADGPFLSRAAMPAAVCNISRSMRSITATACAHRRHVDRDHSDQPHAA